MASSSEIQHYNDSSRTEARKAELLHRLLAISRDGSGWAGSPDLWLDTPYDSVSQAEVFGHVAPVLEDGVFLQVGGTGLAALKALLGGARRSILVTPVAGELDLTTFAATELGIDDRFQGFVGPGEALPIEPGSVDVVVSEGCLHHMDVSLALAEFRRVLRPGGRFGCFDPWRARLYDIGVRVVGKRDPDVDCRPLTQQRMSDLATSFPDSEIRLHGAMTRYPLVALGKVGLRVSRKNVHRIVLFDDRISAHVAWLRRNGSTAAVLGIRT